MAAVPANVNFQIGARAENASYNVHYYYAKCHAFTTTIVLNICTTRLDY